MNDLIARIEMLERRCSMLEALINHRDGLSRAVAILVEESSGEFTEPQLRTELYRRWPNLRPPTEHQQVAVKLHRMCREGQVILIEKARGPKPNVYARNERPPADAGKPGRKRGGGRGLYQAVRSALAVLPELFNVDQLSAVMRSEGNAAIPFDRHSLLHCLSALVKAGELDIASLAQRGKPQVWKRGPVSVSPTGDLHADKEKAWHEFKRSTTAPAEQEN